MDTVLIYKTVTRKRRGCGIIYNMSGSKVHAAAYGGVCRVNSSWDWGMDVEGRKKAAVAYALAAAALYAANVPLSNLLLQRVGTAMLAGLLYLGAGLGLGLYGAVRGRSAVREPLTRHELPYIIAMVVLDIAAPILLMAGIARTTAANVSLLNNFEIVATTLVALLLFRETVSRRLWAAIALVVAASILLGFKGAESLSFSTGSLFVLGACVCWGFENNCTKMLSSKSAVEIVIIKGCGSGLGSLLIALAAGERLPGPRWCAAAMALGFVSYGLSISLYILAQKELGAARTSAFYSIAPFLGVAFSMLLGERPAPVFYAALGIMAAATALMAWDMLCVRHSHMHTHVHTHAHRHGSLVHTHPHAHTHTHTHSHLGGGLAHRCRHPAGTGPRQGHHA